MSGLRVAIEAASQLDPFLDIVEEASTWLWERGIRQWEPGTNRALRGSLLGLIEHGALVIARRDTVMVGGCILSAHSLPAWKERPADALHLSKLVVTRVHAGSGAATRVLRFCEAYARDAGMTHLRLDCWEGNARLRSYYRDERFTELDSVAEHGYSVRLFEKAL